MRILAMVAFLITLILLSGYNAPTQAEVDHVNACLDAPEFNDCAGSGMDDPERW